MQRPTPSGSADRPVSLSRFSLGDMLRTGALVRRAIEEGGTAEASAEGIVRAFHDGFRDEKSGDRQTALVRFYRTQQFEQLSPELRAFAKRVLGERPATPDLRCLTLAATAGIRDEWNDIASSKNHRAIPLPSSEVVERAPMIAGLLRQLGLAIEAVVRPAPALAKESEGKTYNVFHVEKARGSPFIPAQDEFVIPYRVESVVGFGGLIAGELFVVIIFATVPISADAASRFRTIALDIKSGLHGLISREIGASRPAP